jgi:hypothetical protein
MVTELADAIREHGGEGRTFILGFILQDLGASDYNAQDGGHVALLPELSGKEMFAFEYYHSKWTTVDPIPRSFRVRGREGIEEFLDLVNATAVVTFRREWVDYCQRDSRYTQVWQGGRFRLYTRQGSSTPFLRGAGEVRRPSREALELIPKSTEVVLKYRYLDALRANLPGVKLSGEHAFDEDVAEGKTKPVFYIKLEIPQEIVDRQERIRISF